MHDLLQVFATIGKSDVIKSSLTMINMNYQTYGSRGFNLRLRLYNGKETKYVNVNKLLRGDLTKKHWSVKKKCFFSSAPYSDENNDTLYRLKDRYVEAFKKHKGKSLSAIVALMDGEPERMADEETMTVGKAADIIVKRMKANAKNPDGTLSEGFTAYEKVKKRLDEYCQYKGIDFDTLKFNDVTPKFVNDFLYWVSNRGNGRCHYASSALRSLLSKANDEGWFDITPVLKCNWIKKNGKSVKKYESLTNEQCKKLIELDIKELPKDKKAELYRDFCVFILYTCQSPCDALSLKWSDIQSINGMDYFVFKRRKIAGKQETECLVPIRKEMQDIMDRWESKSKDGYIFPVRSKKSLKSGTVQNVDIKHFLSRINCWLKKLSPIIGCKFGLHTYVFRHTGITHYISSGVPHVYVANLAGTSVSNIEKIYYNNAADTKSRDKVLMASF